jgi:hypothetical protein
MLVFESFPAEEKSGPRFEKFPCMGVDGIPNSPVSSIHDDVVPQMTVLLSRVRPGKFVLVLMQKDFCTSIGQQLTSAAIDKSREGQLFCLRGV